MGAARISKPYKGALLFIAAILLFSVLAGMAIAAGAAKKGIALIRYILMPATGVGLGIFLFRKVLLTGFSPPMTNWKGHKSAVLALSAFFAVLFSSLAVLRYSSLHTLYYDLGGYENKIWLVAEAVPSLKSLIPLTTTHFQPFLLVYALIYKFFQSPEVLLVLQALTLASGAIPLFLLAEDVLKSPFNVFVIVALYFLYPAVEFNALNDFHPDHLYVPMSLWAFYLAHKEKYLMSILAIGAGALSKEPFLMGACFFGIYIALQYRRYLLGLSSAAIFFALFVFVFFAVKPLTFMEGEAGHYGYLLSIFSSPGFFVEGLFGSASRKLLFIYFLFFPFLFLSFIQWKRLLPAFPLLAIHLISTNPLRYNPESQYTVGVIGPAFAAFIFFAGKTREKKGKNFSDALLALVLTVAIASNVARSPSVISPNFWSAKWSEGWNYKNYLKGPHEETIGEALKNIPEDKDLSVAAQNNVYHSRLAQRFCYNPLSSGPVDADFVLFDTKRPPMVGDRVDDVKYRAMTENIINSGLYEKAFDSDGVFVFKKIGGAKSYCPWKERLSDGG